MGTSYEFAMYGIKIDGAFSFKRQRSEAIELIEEFAQKGSRLALSDAGVGAAFCRAALFGASLNVFINTKAMADRDTAEKLNKEANDMMAEYGTRAEKVFDQVKGSLN